ncbi:MAG: hypothetical protein M0Z61_06555 [Nitrospiraceae bacterium]|nr:hypothetical protein [Nitrospiraceae bacterium]
MTGRILREESFKNLRDFVYEQSGIFIPDTKKYLVEKRLAGRLQVNHLQDFDQYMELLHGRRYEEEIGPLLDAITTNETYFFREPEHFTIFSGHIVPELVRRNGMKTAINIWSSACSTGEEPYTLAITLKEKWLGLKFNILGSDISNSTIESARKGLYNSYSIRNVPEQYISRYFSFKQDACGYELSPCIKELVRFMNINLVNGRRAGFPMGLDVIFCRNVLIYFDIKSKRRAVSNMYDSLKPGGYLIIGKSEGLHDITRAFKPVIIDNTIIYQRTM